MTTDAKQRRRTSQTFGLMFDRAVLHIRVDDRTRYNGIFLVGKASDLHAEAGCCTCCHGRGAAT